jgi:hypothetical protein
MLAIMHSYASDLSVVLVICNEVKEGTLLQNAAAGSRNPVMKQICLDSNRDVQWITLLTLYLDSYLWMCLHP